MPFTTIISIKLYLCMPLVSATSTSLLFINDVDGVSDVIFRNFMSNRFGRKRSQGDKLGEDKS